MISPFLYTQKLEHSPHSSPLRLGPALRILTENSHVSVKVQNNNFNKTNTPPLPFKISCFFWPSFNFVERVPMYLLTSLLIMLFHYDS